MLRFKVKVKVRFEKGLGVGLGLGRFGERLDKIELVTECLFDLIW